MTITTKQSYAKTNSLLQNAVLYHSWDQCNTYGQAQQDVNAAVANGNLPAFEDAVNTRVGPFDFMCVLLINRCLYIMSGGLLSLRPTF